MSKHTPEPWSTEPNGATFNLKRSEARPHAILVGLLNQPPSEHEANAERIVACVNACEGINPEAIAGLLTACLVLVETAPKKTNTQPCPYCNGLPCAYGCPVSLATTAIKIAAQTS